MHRQSLGGGSPSSNHHYHHLLLSPSLHKDAISPLKTPHQAEDLKPQKKLLYKKPNERLIHVIPLLAILCFLILYLSSHHPSQTEMAQFNNKLQNPIDSIDEIEPLLEISKGDVLAIRSLRNLQEIDKEEGRASSYNYQQLNRKIGDF